MVGVGGAEMGHTWADCVTVPLSPYLPTRTWGSGGDPTVIRPAVKFSEATYKCQLHGRASLIGNPERCALLHSQCSPVPLRQCPTPTFNLLPVSLESSKVLL